MDLVFNESWENIDMKLTILNVNMILCLAFNLYLYFWKHRSLFYLKIYILCSFVILLLYCILIYLP